MWGGIFHQGMRTTSISVSSPTSVRTLINSRTFVYYYDESITLSVTLNRSNNLKEDVSYGCSSSNDGDRAGSDLAPARFSFHLDDSFWRTCLPARACKAEHARRRNASSRRCASTFRPGDAAYHQRPIGPRQRAHLTQPGQCSRHHRLVRP